MAQKPESVFVNSVHKYVKTYHQGMYTPYSAGTPDNWYSGVSDLWIEYKFLKTIPKTIDIEKIFRQRRALHQLSWINRRRKEGRTVWVVIGSKNGGVSFKKENVIVSSKDFLARLKTRKELAQEIDKECQQIKV